MYLYFISDVDEKIRKFKSIKLLEILVIICLIRILKKSCQNRYYLIKEPCFINKIKDNVGSQLSNFTNLFLNKRNNFNLNISDFDNTKPTHNKFKTNRTFNPLEPKYDFPVKYQILNEQESRFIRDSLNINDIKGTKSKTNKEIF